MVDCFFTTEGGVTVFLELIEVYQNKELDLFISLKSFTEIFDNKFMEKLQNLLII